MKGEPKTRESTVAHPLETRSTLTDHSHGKGNPNHGRFDALEKIGGMMYLAGVTILDTLR
jgi:hypothetical protein